MGNLFHDDISTNNIIRGYKIISDYANANDKILLGDGSYITISSLTESLIQRSELDDYVKYVTYSNFTNNIINGTTIIGQSLTASVLKNKRKISLDGVSTSGVVYFDGTTDVTIDITNIDANLIGTGTIDINRLPKGALERLVIVNTETDKFALTSDSVQRGDSVKVLSDGLMYIVIDDTQLSSALGYMTYSAGTSLNSEQLGGVVASEYALKSGVVNYANYSGVATQSYYSGTSSYSTKSLKDGNGNTISTTYLPLTGGIVNGTITASKFVNYTYRDNDYILLSNGGVLSTASFAADNHKHDFHTDILNIITASNNFDFIPNNYNNKLNINYKSINEINDATISSYDFYNGRGIYTLLNASGFVIPSLTNNQNYYLKANGSYGLITDLSYTLPTATSTTLGGVKIGSGVTISSGVISVTQGSIGLGNVNNTADANKSVNYATSAGNADTVDGLHASSFATSTHTHSIYVLKAGDTMTGGLKVNGNLTASGFIIPNGTSNQLLTAGGGVIDKTSIQNYTLPTATSTTLGGVKIGSGVTISSGVISVTQGSIGLGNVNNTADANKSVNYATSAGNADTVDGVHIDGIFTNLGVSGNSITATIGGVTKSITPPYAIAAAKDVNGNTIHDTYVNIHGTNYMDNSLTSIDTINTYNSGQVNNGAHAHLTGVVDNIEIILPHYYDKLNGFIVYEIILQVENNNGDDDAARMQNYKITIGGYADSNNNTWGSANYFVDGGVMDRVYLGDDPNYSQCCIIIERPSTANSWGVQSIVDVTISKIFFSNSVDVTMFSDNQQYRFERNVDTSQLNLSNYSHKIPVSYKYCKGVITDANSATALLTSDGGVLSTNTFASATSLNNYLPLTGGKVTGNITAKHFIQQITISTPASGTVIDDYINTLLSNNTYIKINVNYLSTLTIHLYYLNHAIVGVPVTVVISNTGSSNVSFLLYEKNNGSNIAIINKTLVHGGNTSTIRFQFIKFDDNNIIVTSAM